MANILAGGPRALVAIGLVAAIGGGLAILSVHERIARDEAAQQATGVGADPADDGAIAADAATEAPGDAAAEAPAPRFDVVRVAPDGAAVVAGRAEPGARVTVRAGAEVVAEAEAGPSGEFVAVFRAAPSQEPRGLTLETGAAETLRRSAETVLLLPPAPAATAGEPAEPASAPDVARAAPDPPPAPEVAGAAPEPPAVESVAAPDAQADAADPLVAATAILRPEAETLEIVPGAGLLGSAGGLTLASISYGEQGLVTMAGFASAGARVRVYVDGDHARDAVADGDGRWRLQLDDIAAGVYRLRIDEVRDDGSVSSRLETPFQRDLPAAPGDMPGPETVTVQPGNNLWMIARTHYGRGVLYTQIFTANAELIRDPDIIYPGQIFTLPQVEDAIRPIEGPLARP